MGQHVAAGEVIGGVGHTGDAAGTPNHLHFQVRQNGQWINPFNFLTAAARHRRRPRQRVSPPGATDPFAIDPGGPPSVTDADGDGLIDQFEQLFGTDTTKADTDGDGISDAYETSVSHTDPLSIDTDHDGMTDAVEIANGDGPRARPDPGRGSRRQVSAASRRWTATPTASATCRSRRRARTRWTPTPTTTGSATVSRRLTGSNPLSIDSDHDGLTDGFESAAGTLEPVPQTGVPGGAALDPGGMGAGGLGAGGVGSDALAAGADPLAPGAPGGAGLADLAH